MLAGYAQSISSVGATLAGLREKPTVLNAVGIVASVVGSVAHHLKEGGLVALTSKWQQCRVVGVSVPTWFAPYVVETQGDWCLAKFGGQGVVFHKSTDDYCFVEHSVETLLAQVRDQSWSLCNDAIELGSVKGYGVFQLNQHKPGKAFASDQSEEIWSRLAPFIEAGEPRSLLLDGPPGVGKSTIVRDLTQRVKGRLLRIPSADLDHLHPTVLTGLVTMLAPEVIVIDDFDRAFGQHKLLDFLEHSRSSFKLLVVTTNSLEHIDPAVTRPERFDEMYSIHGLGETFVRTYLGLQLWDALGQDDQDKVAMWPAAYLGELRKRHLRIKPLNLPREVAELEARCRRTKKPAWAEFMSRDAAATTTKEST